MENTYKFWNKYLEDLKIEINKLCEEKKELIVDLHIHSNYSADGKQTVKQILQSTRDKGFDLISITDHDSVEVYNEVYDLVKDGLTKPLIIPGIEFTTDNKEYGNQCHILQLLINPKDKELLKNVNKNYEAMYNRSKIQFKRLKENKAITEKLKTLYENDKEELKKYAKILYAQAKLIEGLSIDNPTEISNLICDLISK